MKRSPITKVENRVSEAKGEVSAEFKKQMNSRFQEKISPLREERIKRIAQRIDPQEQYPYGNEFKEMPEVPGYLNISDAIQYAKEFLSKEGTVNPTEEDIISLATDWLEDRSGPEYDQIEEAVIEYINKNRTAQAIEPISPIAPKQPIHDNKVSLPAEKRKKEIPEGFHEQLVNTLTKKSVMNVISYIVHEDGKYCVKSHKGKNLGCYPTEKEAKHRLQQIEYFKHKGILTGALRVTAIDLDKSLPYVYTLYEALLKKKGINSLEELKTKIRERLTEEQIKKLPTVDRIITVLMQIIIDTPEPSAPIDVNDKTETKEFDYTPESQSEEDKQESKQLDTLEKKKVLRRKMEDFVDHQVEHLFPPEKESIEVGSDAKQRWIDNNSDEIYYIFRQMIDKFQDEGYALFTEDHMNTIFNSALSYALSKHF